MKDSIPSCETARILAAGLSPDHLSGPQRLKQMHSAMVAREKSSLGGKDWRVTGNLGGRKQVQENCPWGKRGVRLQPFSSYTSRLPSTLRNKYEVLE